MFFLLQKMQNPDTTNSGAVLELSAPILFVVLAHSSASKN
jgi:hypothetical protein